LRDGSGRGAEGQATLLVELLRSVQVQGIACDRTTEALGRYVPQGSVLPDIAHGKNEAAVTTDENVLFDVGLRGWGAFGLRFTDGPRSSGASAWFLCNRGIINDFFFGNAAIGFKGLRFLDDHRRTEKKAAEAEGESATKPATVQATIAADGGQVGIIETEARDILEVRAVETAVGAVDDSHTVTPCADDRRADATRALHSRLCVHGCMRRGGSYVGNRSARVACCGGASASTMLCGGKCWNP
jgi:hypothetical protein